VPQPVLDPFTGAGAYVPTSAPVAEGPSRSVVDPFTGQGAYVPPAEGQMEACDQEMQQLADNSNGASQAGPQLKFSPQQQYIGFEAAPDAAKVANKIREFSQSVEPTSALSPDEMEGGGPIDKIMLV
jgi:hypothetical protein